MIERFAFVELASEHATDEGRRVLAREDARRLVPDAAERLERREVGGDARSVRDLARRIEVEGKAPDHRVAARALEMLVDDPRGVSRDPPAIGEDACPM